MIYKQIINKFVMLGVVSMVSISPSPVKAQMINPDCILVPEKIMDIETPIFGGSLKWKRTIAQAESQLGQDRLIKVFDDEDGFLVVGEHKSTETGASSLQIINMDFNGRILDSLQRDLKTNGKVLDVIHHKSTLTVLLEKLGGDGERHTELRVYSEGGKILKSKTYKDEKHIVIPSAMVMDDAGDIFLATQYKRKNKNIDMSSVLYKLDKNLNISWKRSFLPNTATRIHQMISRRGGGFIVAGEIAVDGGKNRKRVGGWLMSLSAQGGMEWQRAYPRGYNSSLHFVHETDNGHIFTAGTAYPSGKGDPAAWVMTNYANSNPIWQRYFKGSYAYKTVGYHVNDNNQSALMMQGTRSNKGGIDHVRILDLSQLGAIQMDHSYIEGNGVEGHGFVSFQDKNLGRYILGSAQMPSTQANNRILDGWIASLNPYRKPDECQ